MTYDIEYSGFPLVLEEYNDVISITNSNQTKSTSCYMFTLEDNAIAYRLIRQTIIVRWIVKSEFVALEMIGSEVEWLKKFLVRNETNHICINALWLPISNNYS